MTKTKLQISGQNFIKGKYLELKIYIIIMSTGSHPN